MHQNQYVVRSNLHEVINLIKDTQENKYAGNLMIWYKCVCVCGVCMCVCVCVERGGGEKLCHSPKNSILNNQSLMILKKINHKADNFYIYDLNHWTTKIVIQNWCYHGNINSGC